VTHKKASQAIVYNDFVLHDKKLVLHTDIMHVDRKYFLVMVCNLP
jgi:hypothetical protein